MAPLEDTAGCAAVTVSADSVVDEASPASAQYARSGLSNNDSSCSPGRETGGGVFLVNPGELITHAAGDLDQAFDRAGFLSGTEATDELVRVGELAAKLDAYRLALVARVNKTQIWRENDPNGTPVSFLRRELTLDYREAKTELRLAESIEEYPALVEALRTGLISRAAVDVICSIGLRNRQRQAVFSEFVEPFIQVAHTATLSKLRQVLRAWADQVDPLTTASEEADAHHRRYLHVSELADGVKLDGFFDTVNGMKIMTALNAAFTAEYKSTHRSGELIHADGIEFGDDTDQECDDKLSTPPVSMSAKQRADAFIKYLVEPALAGGTLPTCGGALPQVLVTVPFDRLVNPAVSSREVEPLQQSILDDQIGCQTGQIATSNGPGKQLLSATSAQLLSCDARVQRVVMGPNSVPLDIGRSTRLIPTHIRRALIVRDQGCVFPFCDKPPGWTEAHHIHHWSKGGPTSLPNLVLLCSKHHHQVHNQNIGITTDPSGRPRITPPHWARE